MTEKPPLIEPNSDRLDLPRFYQDLPKYYQYLSEESRQNWEQFHSQNPETICSNYDLQWEMPKLLSAAISSSQIPIEGADAISANTISLIQKETATPKPVCMYIYFFVHTYFYVLRPLLIFCFSSPPTCIFTITLKDNLHVIHVLVKMHLQYFVHYVCKCHEVFCKLENLYC